MSKGESRRTPAFSSFPKSTSKEMNGEFVTKMMIGRINAKETTRLGASGVANTPNFRTPQSFGSASEVRHIDPKEWESLNQSSNEEDE